MKIINDFENVYIFKSFLNKKRFLYIDRIRIYMKMEKKYRIKLKEEIKNE
jgi:hypothetical protein